MMKLKRAKFSLSEAFIFSLLAVISGSTFLALKVAVQEVPILFLNGMRGVLSGLIIIGLLSFVDGINFSKDDLKKIIVVAVVRRAIPFTCFAYTVVPLSSGLLAVFLASIPIWAFVVDFLTQKLRPTWSQSLGLSVGILGIIYISIPGEVNSVPLWAVFIALLGAVSSTTGSLITFRKTNSPFHVLGIELVLSGLFLFLASGIVGESIPKLSAISDQCIVAVLFLIIFHGFFGQIAHIWIMKLSGEAEGLLYLYVSTPIALVLGIILADEVFEIGSLIACLAILISVYFVRIKKPKTQNLS